MKKTFGSLLAAAVLLGGIAGLADDASAKKKKVATAAPAAAGTTNIADCAKLGAATRDSCISRSRPVTGAELYAKWGSKQSAPAAAAAKVKEAAGAVAAAGATAVAKVKAKLPSGPTNIDECGKVDPASRDACISRSSPVSGADLYKKYKK